MKTGEDTTTGKRENFNEVEADDIEILGKGSSKTPSKDLTDTEESEEEEEEEESEQESEEESAEEEAEEESEEESEEETTEEEEETEGSETDEESEEEEKEDDIPLSHEQVDSVVEQSFGLPTAEVKKKLAELEELKKNPPAIKFPSEKHQKAYEFVTKYSGSDFEGGIVRFARMSSLDVEKLSAKDAMRELFFQENPKLSREKAEKVFEHEFTEKFQGIADEEIAQTKIDLEGDKAKEKLAALKEETKTVKTETDTKQYDEGRNNFIKGVKDSFNEFDQLHLSVDKAGKKDPASEFVFDIPDRELVMQSMSDLDTHYKNMGWVKLDDKGNFLGYDYDKMKVDFAFLYNKESILESYYNHGVKVGSDKPVKEIANRTPKGKKPDSRGKKGGPQTEQDALEEGIMSIPDPKKKR